MRVIDFQEEPEPLLLMPYYPYGNLEDLIVKPPQYVSAFRQVLLGLRHLHGRGVAHRDLKPANLLVAELHPLTIIISDFGFSKFVATDDLLQTFCGTRLYAAPEVYSVGNKDHSKGYRPSADIWSAGVIMLEFIFGRPGHDGIDQLPAEEWIKIWSRTLVKKVYESDENNDQVISVLKRMVKVNPKDRFTADQCLQRGCDNGLFKRRDDGQIVDADDNSEDDATEATTEVDTDIPTSDDSGADDGTTTPTQQLPQETGSGTPNASSAPTILAGGLWGSDESGMQKWANSPSGQLTTIQGSSSGPPSCRQKSLRASDWSMKIGLENSHLDGGFDLGGGRGDGKLTTGIFIRKDYFSASLLSQFAVEDEAGGEAEDKGEPGDGHHEGVTEFAL